MRTGEGFLCVYSVTSRSSFDEISTFYQQILRVKDKDYYPIIIVANKCDLVNERVVSQNEGLELATRFQSRFIECSAKQKLNVDEAFYGLVREVYIVTRFGDTTRTAILKIRRSLKRNAVF